MYSTFEVDAAYEKYKLHVDGFSISGGLWREFSYLSMYRKHMDVFKMEYRAQYHIQ